MIAIRCLAITVVALVGCDRSVEVQADVPPEVEQKVENKIQVDRKNLPAPKIVNVLELDKTTYVGGEIPRAKVVLTNQGDREVVLSKSLDGSSVGWRYPKCQMQIFDENNEPVSINCIGRCGNMSVLRNGDFVRLAPGESMTVSPYGFEGFVGSHQLSQSPGTYWLQYRYATTDQGVEGYAGDERMMKNMTFSKKLTALAAEIPAVTVVSNRVKIVIQKAPAESE